MGREDIRNAKKPYASTNIYNPPAVLPVYTNPLEIGKLLQLQQWPNCPRIGGACHQPHILCKPDMVIVLEEIQFQPPAQAQVAGQAPPGVAVGKTLPSRKPSPGFFLKFKTLPGVFPLKTTNWKNPPLIA